MPPGFSLEVSDYWEPVIGLAEGETRWRGMMKETV
jgi:hypothetical protein